MAVPPRTNLFRAHALHAVGVDTPSPSSLPPFPRRSAAFAITTISPSWEWLCLLVSTSSAPTLSVHPTSPDPRPCLPPPHPPSFLTLCSLLLQIRGFCDHNDFAVVGMAVPSRINLFRAHALRAVGGNGRRMSHNPPDVETLAIYDRLGVIVIDENRLFGNTTSYVENIAALVSFAPPRVWTTLQTWKRSLCIATPGYCLPAPFPPSGSPAQVRRDRNSPSVVLWSICNENGCLAPPPPVLLSPDRPVSLTHLAPPGIPAQVRRDRNSPSVVLWSFCNEYGCEGDREAGGPRFADAVHKYDGSRYAGVGSRLGGENYRFANVARKYDSSRCVGSSDPPRR
jgi:hypothetical protein